MKKTTQATSFNGLEMERISDVDLLAMMAQAAMGHQYAELQLAEQKSWVHSQLDHLYAEMEICREEYFQARQQLSERNPAKLEEFEIDLKLQKEEIFQSRQLH